MLKVTRSLNTKLQSYIQEYGSEILDTDVKVLCCRVCSISINFIFNVI